jgi:hypothetical protein
MYRTLGLLFLALLLVNRLGASGLPVIETHPRILISAGTKPRLLSKMNAADPSWTALKSRADILSTYTILPYKYQTRTDEPPNTIFYDYQGEGWFYAAMPLALAFEMTGDTVYSNKLMELVDEMIRAQSDPDNKPPNGVGPLAPDSYYSTRHICPVLAVVYDWCYDVIGAPRRSAMVTMMNTYFDELRDSAYQRNDHSDGNYFVGHLFATAMMGYASFGDNPRAQEMIDYARIRFDGTSSALIDQDHTPADFFTQQFEGGVKPEVARDYLGPNITGAPFKGGFDFQGWAYATATFDMIIDYMLAVKSATTEDLAAPRMTWFSQILRAEKHTLMPNHFETDPSGDFGSIYGAVVGHSLPLRLAFMLAGSADGPGAQHFVTSEIAAASPLADFPDYIYQEVYKPREWESFFFADPARPSTELALPPYYTAFGPVYPQGGATNGASPFFWMRSDWSSSATWASFRMGAAWYDDHQHLNAGHLEIKHGNDFLLVDASSWKGDAGSIGIVGSSLEEEYSPSAVANTLYFNDFGTFQSTDQLVYGGQGVYGRDEVAAAELTDQYSYVRSDLSSAYNRAGDPADEAGRGLDYFYRSIFYIRQAGDFFVLLDQVKAKPSIDPAGQYRKHMRWHFPNRPTAAGTKVTVVQGTSSLNMDVLLPQNATVTLVDESNNPDPCDGSVTPCTPYGMNSGTWRAEVRDPVNPLYVPFLTVFKPGAASAAPISSTLVESADSSMVGARISLPSGALHVVMFNHGTGQVPATPALVTYEIAGAAHALHTLGGMKPASKYTVTITDPTVTVREDAAGTALSSGAGVLQFGQAVTSVTELNDLAPTNFVLEQNHPNPFNPSTTIRFGVPSRSHVTLTVFNTLGQEVAELVNGDIEGGYHEVHFNASALASGIYFYRLQAGRFVQTHSLCVLK